jgi:hypothetical protein
MAASGQYNVLTFHGDRQRTGWIWSERILTPRSVSGGTYGPVWNSPQFDPVTIGGKTYPAHVYASPLYVERVTLSGGDFAGRTLSVVYAASSNGFVYAVSASPNRRLQPVAPGTILSRRQLNTPGGTLDGGVPVIDLGANPPRLYVTSVDATLGWQAFALGITRGNLLPGWPIHINNDTVAGVNQNGPSTFYPAPLMGQRDALNLSHDAVLLHIPFGAYGDNAPGWMVAVDTRGPAITSAFSGAPSSIAFANGGMWASGGRAIDDRGNLYSTTGNGPVDIASAPGYWGQSVLVWAPGLPLRLVGTYTPGNYWQMEKADIDLAGGAAIVLPDLGEANTTTPRLITQAFGVGPRRGPIQEKRGQR